MFGSSIEENPQKVRFLPSKTASRYQSKYLPIWKFEMRFVEDIFVDMWNSMGKSRIWSNVFFLSHFGQRTILSRFYVCRWEINNDKKLVLNSFVKSDLVFSDLDFYWVFN